MKFDLILISLVIVGGFLSLISTQANAHQPQLLQSIGNCQCGALRKEIPTTPIPILTKQERYEINQANRTVASSKKKRFKNFKRRIIPIVFKANR